MTTETPMEETKEICKLCKDGGFTMPYPCPHQPPNKEECHCVRTDRLKRQDSRYDVHTPDRCYKVSPSDKTWEERFRNLAPNGLVELVDFEGTKPVFDFIQQEITSATIKAKEEVATAYKNPTISTEIS